MLKLPVISSSIVVIVVVVCIGLANWQWQRADQKQQRLDNIDRMQQKGLLSWSGLTLLSETLDKTGLRLQLQGRVESRQYWLLDNRTLNGRPGYDVLATFYPTGSTSGLLVNFGWVAQGLSRNKLPQVQLPEQQISITAQLKQGDLAGFYLPGAELAGRGWPKLIQFIDIPQQAQQSQTQLVDFMAYAVDKDSFAQPHYQPVIMPPEKHLAYALQWLLIALSAVVVFVFAMRNQYQQDKFSDTEKKEPSN
ncbi:transmembrane cytochrome oxidase complex biogenesis factor [Psychromonas ingrahamii 37]|uniref:SURF1-like protein n=1 Tax=Psychromonas ingrahamii (strain DSM 17664 / CCUG 51855 / 37) TaxID=357804 RepID=A1SY58_PSYIN|nr:SURF1 family protein [Psychromonas ingrahamii]ABM04423.1 transmembrane cytochrome oxidase complex biogenesis factor [Psychromonas ingrahamii 37]